MTNDELALELFRLNYRIFVQERLVLRLAFARLASRQGKSSAESRQELREILESESRIADTAFAKNQSDAAIVGLYVEEAREIVDSLIDLLMSLPDPELDVLK